MLTHSGRAGIEYLVEALCQTLVGHIVSPVDQGDILGRKQVGDETFQHGGAGGRFGTRLYHSRVAAGDACSQHAQRQQHREVERADNQCNAIGHLIYLGHYAGKAHQPTIVAFGSCPTTQPTDGLVDFGDDRKHVT